MNFWYEFACIFYGMVLGFAIGIFSTFEHINNHFTGKKVCPKCAEKWPR